MIFQRAKSLRENTTKHEGLLWQELGSNKMLGLRFKRQHPISTYIVDFYCHKLKLVIEIDGPNHNEKEQKEYDQNRTQVLSEFGITVMRFTNEEVEFKLSEATKRIKDTCKKLLLVQ